MTTRAMSEPTAVVVRDSVTSPIAIVDLIRLAIEKEIPVEALERLQALHERVSDRAAAVEFAEALATFQATCPSISRNKLRDNVTKSGIRIAYRYAELDHVVRVIRPYLRPVGLSYTWDSTTAQGMLACRCTLRHVNGHSASSTFTVPTESPNPGMTDQQKHAGALTYARRQSLILVLGLTTCDPDDDGAEVRPISADQATDLQALLEETKTDRVRFLKWARVERVEDILERDFESCIKTIRELERRRAVRQKGSA